ncbi:MULTISPECIES: MoaD/ThiS family protein [Flavobacterium]|uniref:MoaD/ThiS family protein n=3 Tax=Flavobacterium TaxID=237 RepID=A0AA94F120_9FLAO|nr:MULTISPECIES: MoaD/ThiS family protein [Flavobacterium]OXA76218.1 molybdopterin synthase sulfur carrier subunit [Flavobacterium columnare NBRC 100251 = ATCC 23463]AMA49044.1 hypothetical protein AWN65_05990 [Flavobacterium covae]AND64882.1 hypothetical protein AX766_11035 [Flavobacterium covae]MCH4830975.1 MoaD/ThiS family protein [Flavobacterium columnare]MCH4833084.1 MoaD/ThiS family protein [Flavobacterium columnare]
MQIKIKYFGQLIDLIGLEEEIIEIDKNEIICAEIIELLSFKYEKLEKTPFKIAINKKIQDSNYKINKEDEIALLPPFAGG